MRHRQHSRPPARRSTRLTLLALGGAALVLGACSGSGPQSSLEPRGQLARDIDGLWRLVFILATIVFVIVAAGLVISMVRFRERSGDDREPKQVHGNTALEITWTIIPAVLLAVIAVPTMQGLFDLRTKPAGDVLDVGVVGHQWWWEFTYPEFVGAGGEPLRTANELHIPAGRDVYLTMTSADVIHSFWVPPLNGKRDVVPGRFTNLTLRADVDAVTEDTGFGPGVIPGQCAEFCGLAHADMRLRVFVHTPEDFAAWVESQLQPAAIPTSGPAASGFETFELVCTACHQATVEGPDGIEVLGPLRQIEVAGETVSSALAPNLTHFGSRSTFAGATLAQTQEHLAAWLADPPALKPMAPARNDIPAGRILGMPNLGLTQEDIAGLVELLGSWR